VFSFAQGRFANLSDQVFHDVRITQDGFEWTTERAGLWKDYKTPLLVPHRSIAIGLTLLSAYLILWPVKPNQKHARSGQPRTLDVNAARQLLRCTPSPIRQYLYLNDASLRCEIPAGRFR
jgi:hypothetical protein